MVARSADRIEIRLTVAVCVFTSMLFWSQATVCHEWIYDRKVLAILPAQRRYHDAYSHDASLVLMQGKH